MYLLVRLFILIRLGNLGAGFIIERPSNGAGDLFSSTLNLRDGTNPITRLNCDDNFGGKGRVYYKNYTTCSCYWGQTFFLDGRTPKCMEEYGQDRDDLECKYRINGQQNVKVLTQALLTSSATIGEVIYKSSDVSNHKITGIFYWNMTWIRPTESGLFSFSNEYLQWTAVNPAKLARKYSGLLFKLQVSGKERGRNWKFSCLLLKISGSRNYPLPALQQSSSTSSPRITKSTSLSPSSQISTSTTKVLKTSFPTIIARSTPFSTYSRLPLTTILSQSSYNNALSTTKLASFLQSSSYQFQARTPSTSMSLSSQISTSTTKVLKTLFSTMMARSTSFSTYSRLPLSTILSQASNNNALSTTKLASSVQSSSFQPQGGSHYQENSTVYHEKSSSLFVVQSTFIAKSVWNPPVKSPSSLRPDHKASSHNRISVTAPSSRSSVSPTSSPTSNPNGNVGKQKEKGSNVATIAGIVVGLIAAAFAFAMVIFLCRRKYPSKNRKRRRETLMLNLTANSFTNENQLDPTANLNGTRKTLDNPVYDNKLMLQKPGNNLAAGAYENRGLPTSETPVYQETGGMYEPLSKNNKPVSESEHYQPIDVSTLPRAAQPLQSPIYQVLDDGAVEEPSAQSPVYQTVEQDAYQAIDNSGAQSGDAFYAQLDSGTSQPPLQEPLYRELDTYANGHLNVEYEDDEGAI